MAKEVEGLAGADCTTDTPGHHRVSAALLNLGLNTMCEKPLALTIRSCDLIISAAEQSGKILSVAENFRRDPINRLVRALLDDGAIGERQFMMETSVWGRDTIFITPWRHMKLTGAVTLDAGVHNADIMQYYFGDPASAFGQGRLFETTRRKAAGSRSRQLLGSLGEGLPGRHQADRRRRDVRHDQLQERRSGSMGFP